jgi:hypothetical protein
MVPRAVNFRRATVMGLRSCDPPKSRYPSGSLTPKVRGTLRLDFGSNVQSCRTQRHEPKVLPMFLRGDCDCLRQVKTNVLVIAWLSSFAQLNVIQSRSVLSDNLSPHPQPLSLRRGEPDSKSLSLGRGI